MKSELKNVIDQILRCTECDVDPNLLHPDLQKAGYLTVNEVDIIKRCATSVQQILQIFQFLKQKDEKAFMTLQQICHDLGYVDLFNRIQIILKEGEREDLLFHPPISTKANLISSTNEHFNGFDSCIVSANSELETVCQNLKAHYEQDLELIEIQWQKFNVSGTLEMDVFYNQNILIEDKNKKLKTKLKNFQHLFLTKWKRIIITAGAGYGKSTFVHEMARQWIKGKDAWTKKFSFVFLFRLTEVSRNNTESLKSLLAICLNTKDALKVSQWLEDAEHMEKSLFIFDGLDELRYQFCKEIDDLIFGKGVKHAYVVITSRSSKELEEKFQDVFCNSLYIELKGYTEDGVKRQLEKFNIIPKVVENNLMDILKVPLFNTLFCITHKEAAFGCLNICNAIEKFVSFACRRYRRMNTDFTSFVENETLLLLGQAAQNKFSLMQDVNIEYPNVTLQHLSTAINIGLVSKKSTIEDFVFAHQTLAEYCAAYFWIRKSRLKIHEIESRENLTIIFDVLFAEPKGGRLNSIELFSSFLSHLNDEYKLFLWQNFKYRVPLLDEYDSLPKRRFKEKYIDMAYIPFADQNTVMDKIEFLSDVIAANFLCLHRVNFVHGKKFENAAKMNDLELLNCSFDISPEEFFHSYNIKYLGFKNCTFNYWEPVGEGFNKNWSIDFILEHLRIKYCGFTVVNFLSYIMKHCTTLKTFVLLWMIDEQIETTVCNFDYFGDGWISELKNNELLLHSIEHFKLASGHPLDLTILFQTLGKMVNLKKFQLCVYRKLTEAEINSLSLSSKNGWKKLEYLSIDHCDCTVVKFLSFIMRHCTTLKTFDLQHIFENRAETTVCNFDYFGDGWISELENNKLLLHSIEHFVLISYYPVNLTILFQTLGNMVNLKKFHLSVERKFTEAEINSLSLSSKNGWKKLEYLSIDRCDCTVVKFLSFIMRHSTTLKTFKLLRIFEGIFRTTIFSFDYFGEGWIKELENNKPLLHSIEYFKLISYQPTDLTILFRILGKMVNLKKFHLSVERKLYEAEINSLSLSFEKGLKKLDEFKFALKEETRKEINEKNKGHIILGCAFCEVPFPFCEVICVKIVNGKVSMTTHSHWGSNAYLWSKAT